MPDELRSPIKHYLVLHRPDPERQVRRFYSLMIERDLFGTVRLARNWGRIGTNSQEKVEVFASEIKAIVSAGFSEQKGPGCPGPFLLPQR
jgi:predicted DNA-binding WGR domain protein